MVDMATSNSHAPWPGTCYDEAELSRNCVRSSITAGADLNHYATLPHVKTSWQSLTLQVAIVTFTYDTFVKSFKLYLNN